MDFDGRRSGGSGYRFGSGGLGAIGSVSFGRGKKARSEREKKPEAPKPPTLSSWLGKGKFGPPSGSPEAPTFSDLKSAFPETLPDGKAYSRKTPPPSFVEKLGAPGEHPKYQRWLELDANRGREKDEPHWHGDGRTTDFFHLGAAWGRHASGRWTWMKLHKRRWWTVADGAQRMVRHDGHWWWKTEGGWFVLREGTPWAWKHFPEWRRAGLLDPKTGVKIVYSEDGARVAVSQPGGGTYVFDARTGELLDRFPERGR